MNEYEKQANEFLQKTGTDFKVEFNRFDSMSWDKEGDRRNIFDVTLSNSNGSYTFEFGSSIADSCAPSPKIETDGKLEIYKGVALKVNRETIPVYTYKMEVDYSDALRISKNELDPIDIINMVRLGKELNECLEDFFSQYVESYRGMGIYGRDMDIKKERIRNTYTIDKVMEDIGKEIAESVDELSKETVLINQAEEIVEPSPYNVLACLTKLDPGTFEDFCSEFGYDEDSRKAESTYHEVCEEYNNVSALFTDEELEEMQEIQ